MVSADRAGEAERGTGTAMVVLTPTLEWARKGQLPRPDSGFVTQLIANAEHLPQTSRLRRVSTTDAQTAYRSKRMLPSVGARTRQVA